jgi:cytochrome c oxidase subunit 2
MARVLFASLAALAAGIALPPIVGIAFAQISATPAAGPKVVRLEAGRYDYTPNPLVLKKGEPVVIALTTRDGTHGFDVAGLKLNATVRKGETVDIPVTPSATGTYKITCDHFCGFGHFWMDGRIEVVE